MEFEYHITMSDLKKNEQENFINLCNEVKLKPVLIVLDQGEYIHQPMITGIVHSTNYDEVKNVIEEVGAKFRDNGFTVVRTKVEIPAKEEAYFDQPMLAQSKPYFEWHGKVYVDDVVRLKQLCADSGGHISRNSLNANGKIRFVTVREYNSSEKFYSRVEKIHNILQQNKIELLKQQYELCIYDSQEELDRGWI
jgi:hypothetical protein